MIAVKLIGGLGNQLFQYAFARKIALIYSTNLYLDLSAFEEYKLHKYSLQNFNLKAHFLNKKDRFNYNLVQEKGLGFDQSLLNSPDQSYFSGYFQSELYFKSIENYLFKELDVKIPQTDYNLKYSKLISDTTSVSLHIRRADYITNSETNKIHGTCSINYYQEAINYISKKPKI